MRVIFASQRIEFTTGYRIDAAKWDADKQRVKNGCTNKLKQSASDNNTDLLRYYTIMQEVFKEYEVKDIMPTPQEIKDSFNNKVNPTEEVQEEHKGFWEIFNEFVSECGKQKIWYVKLLTLRSCQTVCPRVRTSQTLSSAALR